MADKHSPLSLLVSNTVSYQSRTSRYRSSLQYDGWAIEDDFVLYPDNEDTQFFVDSFTAKRPDLISYAVYNNPLLAWVIMRRNGIQSSDQIISGLVLWVPSLKRINERGGILSS